MIDGDDRFHRAVVEVVKAARDKREHLYVPALVLCEVDYVLQREKLSRALPALVEDLLSGAYELVVPTPVDLRFAMRLLAKYPVGLTDATVAALADRSGRKVVTIDRRDFVPLRGSGGKPFTLLPDCSIR